MATPNLGQIQASTLRNRSKTVADAVTNHNPLLTRMDKKGLIKETFSGGRSILEPIMYGTNNSAKFYTGYDTFTPDTASEVLDASEWPLRQLGAFITWSGLEKIQNRGSQQAVDLMAVKEKHAVATLKNMFAASIFSDGTAYGSKEFSGLRLICANDPTAAGTVGGIDQVANPWWRNKFSAAASTTSANIWSRMNDMDLAINRGADTGDIAIGGQFMFRTYEDSLQPLQRITSAKSADAGFTSYAYKTKELFYDYNCPTKSLYMLDTDSLAFRYAKDRWFDVGDSRTVNNADYDVVPIWVAGNLTCSDRARNGVILAS